MRYKFLAIVCGLLIILSLSYCKDGGKTTETSPYLNHNDSVKYLGIQACASCHADKFATFTQTGMGSSFGLATLKKSAGDFKQNKPVYDAFRNLYYLPFFRDSIFYLNEYRLDGNDTIYSRTERISYIVGSGHHTNSHFIQENGFVFQAPITFYTQKGQWDLPPGFENGNNSGFERKIGLECMSCHNALPQLISGSENQYRELPHGIDCERCHGPGELHVNEKSKGIIVDVSKQPDYTIVNPAKLSWKRQIDVCQRCHLQGDAVLKPGKNFTDFKPGMKLSDVFDQFSPEYEGSDDIVMAAHAERFQRSKCFISSVKGNLEDEKAKVGFTCISCHNPHVSVRQTNTDVFNTKCRSCHSTQTQKQCSESALKISAASSNCVKCHMPASGTADIPHVSVHDHYIRKPEKVKPVQGKLKGLKCVTNANPDAATLTEAYVSYYEKFDANPLFLQLAAQKSSELNTSNTEHLKILIHLHYINSDYAKLIELADDLTAPDAWSAYRIGKAYERLKRYDEADVWMDKAIALQPKNLDFLLQKASMLVKNSQFKKAQPVVEKYLKLYSKSAEAWALMGLVQMNSNSPSLAKQSFLKALSYNPDQLTALNNLLTLETLLGNQVEIAKLKKRIDVLQR